MGIIRSIYVIAALAITALYAQSEPFDTGISYRLPLRHRLTLGPELLYIYSVMNSNDNISINTYISRKYARQDIPHATEAPVRASGTGISLLKNGWRRMDALWGIRLSMTFVQNYYVGITAGVSFTPLASFGNNDKKIRVHRNSIAISLGYNF